MWIRSGSGLLVNLDQFDAIIVDEKRVVGRKYSNTDTDAQITFYACESNEAAEDRLQQIFLALGHGYKCYDPEGRRLSLTE